MKRSKASSGSSKRPEHRPIGRRRSIEDDVLAVLIDERSGREYYVSMLDNFPYKVAHIRLCTITNPMMVSADRKLSLCAPGGMTTEQLFSRSSRREPMQYSKYF